MRYAVAAVDLLGSELARLGAEVVACIGSSFRSGRKGLFDHCLRHPRIALAVVVGLAAGEPHAPVFVLRDQEGLRYN